MFVVLLRFADNQGEARAHMAGHEAWLRRGFDRGVFVLAGGLVPRSGGAIVAHGITRDALEAIVAEDPFVEHGVVRAELIEIAPGKTDPRLAFLADA